MVERRPASSTNANQPTQRSRPQSPNIIGNCEDENTVSFGGLQKIDFAAIQKNHASLQATGRPTVTAMTMTQFLRNVDSKNALMTALKVKG